MSRFSKYIELFGSPFEALAWAFGAQAANPYPQPVEGKLSKSAMVDNANASIDTRPDEIRAMSKLDRRGESARMLKIAQDVIGERCAWSLIVLRHSHDQNTKAVAAQFVAINIFAETSMPVDYVKVAALNWGGEPAVTPALLIEVSGKGTSTENRWRQKVHTILSSEYSRAVRVL